MIGAGPAGLSAARHLRTFGIQVLDQFNYGPYGGGGGGAGGGAPPKRGTIFSFRYMRE